MKYEFISEVFAPTRTLYTFTDKTPAGETLAVEVIACAPDNTNPRSLPRLWQKAGFTGSLLPSYWSVNTYVTDADGLCTGRYNPTVLPGKNALDFSAVLEATPENLETLLHRVYALATNRKDVTHGE